VDGRTPLSFGDRLSIIAERAPALRQAGVLTISDGDCAFSLSPFERELPKDQLPKIADDNNDPLFDPASYPDGKVPGYNLTDDLDGKDPS